MFSKLVKTKNSIESRLVTAFLDNGSQKSLSRKAFLDKPRPAGRPASGRLSRTDVGGALVVSGAKKRSI